jgi:transposase InsO family protein
LIDLSGKISPASFGGKQYYFKITDHFTQFCYFYLLSSKSETFTYFLKYYNEVTNKHTCNIKTIIFDGGGKFNSKEFLGFLSDKGVAVQVTAPYTPQQNTVAERANHTTSEKARCMLKQANLPSEYWGEVVNTAVFLKNITPIQKLKWKTPYQLWHIQPFNNSCLKPFGCLAFANIPKPLRDVKFGNTSRKGLLVGYQHGAHNWRVLLPGGKVERCHDVTFHIAEFPAVSIFSPADPSSQFDPLAGLEFLEANKQSTQDGPDIPASPSFQDVPDWQLAKDELNLDSPLIDVGCFFPPNEEEDAVTPTPDPPFPRPRSKAGFDILLTPNVSPKDISSAIDKSNILHTKTLC